MGHLTHGKSRTVTYTSWLAMKARCYNPLSPGYQNYGGRGIKVCQAWKNSFIEFYSDMGDRPPELSLERINKDGDYEPSNCRWATDTEQVINRRMLKHNKSGYIGVSFVGKTWNARIRVDKRLCHLGCYSDAEEAAIVYDQAAIFFRGNLAVTNIL